MSKIGDRPTVRIPTFEVPERQRVTDKLPAFKPGTDTNSAFVPTTKAPVVVNPQLPVNPAAIPGYGTPDALKDVMAELEKLPGLQAGVTKEAREAAIAQARDTLIAVGKQRGLELSINIKANGQPSLDAFQWRKSDGSVAVIDFALASKDTMRATKMQWLDVTNGGGGGGGGPYDFFYKMFADWAKSPGAKSGSTKKERNDLLSAMKAQLIAAGAAAGDKLEPNVVNGVESMDSVLMTRPDGSQVVLQFAGNADDLSKDLELFQPPRPVSDTLLGVKEPQRD